MATNRSTRSAYYISTLSVSMILFLLGVIAYTVINVSKASEQLMNDMCITVLIKDGIKKDELKALEKSLLATSGVERLEYTSKEDAAAEFNFCVAANFFNHFADQSGIDRLACSGSVKVNDMNAFGPHVRPLSCLIDCIFVIDGDVVLQIPLTQAHATPLLQINCRNQKHDVFLNLWLRMNE